MIRLAVRAPDAVAERVLAALLELAPSGVEEVDGDGFVEYAVYGAPGELPELAEGAAEVDGVAVTVSGTEVADDWADRWRRFHRPLLVGDRVYVRPPWEPPSDAAGVSDLVIDPGQAFGTGAHATTRLSLELLLEFARRERHRGSVCDLGCGSGVLAIAAAQLGFGPVSALDSDPLAIDATAANATANGVELTRIDRIDLREDPHPPAELVLANLMRPLLLQVAELAGPPPRAMILSGLLEDEVDEITAAFGPALRCEHRLSDTGWSAMLLERV